MKNPIRKELLDELLAEYANPEDLTGPEGIRKRLRDQGVVQNKSAYIALGMSVDGHKEVLGIWLETTEGAKFWLKVISELKTAGSKIFLSPAAMASRASLKLSRLCFQRRSFIHASCT